MSEPFASSSSSKSAPFVFGELLSQAAQNSPQKTAIIDRERRISYAELDCQANAFANELITRGIGVGERVCIYLDKSIEAIIAMYGVARAGGIFVNINPKLMPAQVAYQVTHCTGRYFVAETKAFSDLVESDFEIPQEQFISADSLRKIVEDGDTSVPNRFVIETDICAILYTSGSTGKPKGAVLNHRNMVLGAQIVIEYLHNSVDDVILSVLPFSFDYGLNQLTTSTLVGATLVLQHSIFPNDICRSLHEHKITAMAGVPTIWIQLLQRYSSFTEETFPDLRYITNSGGAVPVNVVEQLKTVLDRSDAKLYLMYGLTEAFRSTFLPPDQLANRPTSMGKAIPNVEVMVVRPDGSLCDPEEEGILVHRGGVVFQGYWNDPEATAKVLKSFPFEATAPYRKEPVVWSGDTVKKDKEGFLYFVGRRDEMIKSAGNRISPQEVEEILYRMPEIDEAVVFGKKDDVLGQAVTAVISLKAGREIAKKDVKKFAKTQLPEYMVPRFIEVIEAMPKTPHGKIDRPKVKTEFTDNQSR